MAALTSTAGRSSSGPMPRRKALKPPTIEFLLALKTELEQQYQSEDNQIDRMRRVRLLEQPVPIPDNLRLTDVEVRDPAVGEELGRVAAMLSVNPPKLQVTPTREGSQAAQENATLREKWTQELLQTAGSKHVGLPTFHAIVDSTVADGGGWSKLVPSRDLWDTRYAMRLADFEAEEERDRKRIDAEAAADADSPEQERSERQAGRERRKAALVPGARRFDLATEEAKRAAGPPFVWLPVDARQVYPVYQGLGLGAVLEIQERSESQTFRDYRLGRDTQGNVVPEEFAAPTSAQPGGARTVTFLEYWDSVYYAYVIIGSNAAGQATTFLVEPRKHRYGQVPYFFSPGLWIGHWRNRKVGWSVAELMRWLVEYRAFLWTLHAQMAARDALSPMVHERGTAATPLVGEDGKPKADRDLVKRWRLGEILEGQPGDKFYVPQFPDPQGVLRELELVTAAIQRLQTAQPSGPISGGLEGAGFAISQVLSETRLKHDPIAQSIERHLLQVTLFAWRLVREYLRETVWVHASGDNAGWLGAGPEDLQPNVVAVWTLDIEKPSGKLIEGRYHGEQVQAGFESLDQAIEAQGRNPDEVRQGKALDELRQTDEYKKALQRYVWEHLGKGNDLEAAAVAGQVAQSGELPPGVVPPPGGLLGQTGMPPAGPPGGVMGGPGMPGDQGNLALAPGGVGAAPLPSNSPALGTSPGAVVPELGGAAAMQSLNVGQ